VKKSAKLSLDIKLVLVALVSVTWIFWPNHFEPFIFSKFILLLLLGAWTLGLIIVKSREFSGKMQYPFLSLLFVGWFGFLAIRDDVFNTSLFGVQGRNMGLLSYLSLIVISLYFVGSSSNQLLDKTVLTFMITCLGIALYGLLQVLKIDPFDWRLVYEGIIGNFGNPNFMSVMGAFFGAASFYFVIKSKKFHLGTIGVAGILISAIVIYFSKSTQGWIVLLIAVTPMLYLQVMRFGKLAMGIFPTFIIAFSVLGGLAIFNIGPLRRILYQESLSYRSDFWDIAWRMAKDNPLFGVGIDRYQNFYREYKTLEQVRSVGAEDFSDSAHNLYLHFAATGGFLLAILVLLINLFVAYRFVIAFKVNADSRLEIALIFGVWLGIQGQNLISIDYPSIALWGWVFAGLGVGLSYQRVEKPVIKEIQLGRKYVGLLVSIVMTALALFVVTPISNAQSLLRTGFYAYVSKGDSGAIRIKNDFLKEMESKDPGNPTLPILSANSLFQDEAFEEAAAASRRAIALDSHDYRSWWFLASSLEKLEKRVEAIEAREMTVKLSPFNVANLLELGKNQLATRDLPGARETLEQIARVDANSTEFQELTSLISQTP
jgi:O-antigen ligase